MYNCLAIPNLYDVPEFGFGFIAIPSMGASTPLDCGLFIDIGEGEDCVRTSISFTAVESTPQRFLSGERFWMLHSTSAKEVLSKLAAKVAKRLPENVVIVSAFTAPVMNAYFKTCKLTMDECDKSLRTVFEEARPKDYTLPLDIKGSLPPMPGIKTLRYMDSITTICIPEVIELDGLYRVSMDPTGVNHGRVQLKNTDGGSKDNTWTWSFRFVGEDPDGQCRRAGAQGLVFVQALVEAIRPYVPPQLLITGVKLRTIHYTNGVPVFTVQEVSGTHAPLPSKSWVCQYERPHIPRVQTDLDALQRIDRIEKIMAELTRELVELKTSLNQG